MKALRLQLRRGLRPRGAHIFSEYVRLVARYLLRVDFLGSDCFAALERSSVATVGRGRATSETASISSVVLSRGQSELDCKVFLALHVW